MRGSLDLVRQRQRIIKRDQLNSHFVFVFDMYWLHCFCHSAGLFPKLSDIEQLDQLGVFKLDANNIFEGVAKEIRQSFFKRSYWKPQNVLWL